VSSWRLVISAAMTRGDSRELSDPSAGSCRAVTIGRLAAGLLGSVDAPGELTTACGPHTVEDDRDRCCRHCGCDGDQRDLPPWKTPASSGLRRRDTVAGPVIVFLASCGSAEAHASALKRFRRSEKLRESASRAMRIPLFLRLEQVRGLADATRRGGHGRGRTADLPLFRGSIPLYDHDLVNITRPAHQHKGWSIG
jgi:hypothetical protein